MAGASGDPLLCQMGPEAADGCISVWCFGLLGAWQGSRTAAAAAAAATSIAATRAVGAAS